MCKISTHAPDKGFAVWGESDNEDGVVGTSCIGRGLHGASIDGQGFWAESETREAVFALVYPPN